MSGGNRPNANYVLYGNPMPNFNVRKDRVVNSIRVTDPTTLHVPPAHLTVINPQSPDPPGEGNNDPATNTTLRGSDNGNGLPQEGALVYCKTPILNSNAPGDPNDGCFDGRNHLYFSDGKEWIPLANCLPQGSDCAGPQYAEYSIHANDEETVQHSNNDGVGWWHQPVGLRVKGAVSAQGFTVDWETPVEPHWGHGQEYKFPHIEYTGSCDIDAHVSVAASWQNRGQTGPNEPVRYSIAVVKNPVWPQSDNQDNTHENNLQQDGILNYSDVTTSLAPRNVSIDGFVKLKQGDKLIVKIVNRGDSSGEQTDRPVIVRFMNLNVVKLGNSVPEEA